MNNQFIRYFTLLAIQIFEMSCGPNNMFKNCATSNCGKRPLHQHDFHITLMHLFAIDHERLTFKLQGRRFRLTDVHGHMVKDIVS
jgi:2'-5' RNA ligase